MRRSQLTSYRSLFQTHTHFGGIAIGNLCSHSPSPLLPRCAFDRFSFIFQFCQQFSAHTPFAINHYKFNNTPIAIETARNKLYVRILLNFVCVVFHGEHFSPKTEKKKPIGDAKRNVLSLENSQIHMVCHRMQHIPLGIRSRHTHTHTEYRYTRANVIWSLHTAQATNL